MLHFLELSVAYFRHLPGPCMPKLAESKPNKWSTLLEGVAYNRALLGDVTSSIAAVPDVSAAAGPAAAAACTSPLSEVAFLLLCNENGRQHPKSEQMQALA